MTDRDAGCCQAASVRDAWRAERDAFNGGSESRTSSLDARFPIVSGDILVGTHEADPTAVREFELRLADEYLERLLAWVPDLAEPADVEGYRDAELGGRAEHPVGSGLSDREVFNERVILPLLRQLREHDDKALQTGYASVRGYHLLDFVSFDEDGRVHCDIAAVVGDGDDGRLLIPLRAPFDVRWVALLRGLVDGDRVRFLTEFVRVLGNVVCFAGLPERLRGEVVRGLRELVGLLRAAIRDARNDQTADTGGSANGSGDRFDP